jgi:hypothetical protein
LNGKDFLVSKRLKFKSICSTSAAPKRTLPMPPILVSPLVSFVTRSLKKASEQMSFNCVSPDKMDMSSEAESTAVNLEKLVYSWLIRRSIESIE